MKNFGTVLIACLSVTACAMRLPDVPAPATSDMETTTNKVFAAGMFDGDGDFVLTADFATTSNTLVQVAFGVDDDQDDALSLDEKGWVFGWFDGTAFVRSGSFSNAVDVAACQPPLELRVKFYDDNVPESLCVNGTTLTQESSTWPRLIDGFTPSDWTALRVTQRGDLSSTGLSLYVSVTPEKLIFILK